VYLLGDTALKPGQIAHLDHDRNNNHIDNLCFLCQAHHDQYDSRTSQTKALTEREVRVYRGRLYASLPEILNPSTRKREMFPSLRVWSPVLGSKALAEMSTSKVAQAVTARLAATLPLAQGRVRLARVALKARAATSSSKVVTLSSAELDAGLELPIQRESSSSADRDGR